MYIFVYLQIDRLKLLNREAEEKAEGSELQINRISTEYRTLLEEKEVSLPFSLFDFFFHFSRATLNKPDLIYD